MDSACTEHDVMCLLQGPAGRGPDADTDSLLPLKRDPIDEGIAENREVRTVAGRLQVGIIGRHAGVRPTMHGPGRYAGTLWRIVIVGPSVAQIQGGGAERLPHGAPLLDECTIN